MEAMFNSHEAVYRLWIGKHNLPGSSCDSWGLCIIETRLYGVGFVSIFFRWSHRLLHAVVFMFFGESVKWEFLDILKM